MDFELGKEAFQTGTNYVNKKMEKVNFSYFRHYFNIDNTYLIQKLFLILFPYNKKQWEDDDSIRISRPDLYIPIMSFWTYILVRAMYFGLENKFTPDKIGMIFTRTIFLEIVLNSISKAASYILDIPIHFLDLVCYSGYKYFVILIMHLCRLKLVKIVFGLYIYVSFFFFLSRCMKTSILSTLTGNRKRKIYFLFSLVACQTILVFFLS